MLKTILNKWADELGDLPLDYLCFDMETTGVDRDEDLIVELGYCPVINGHAEDHFCHVLDWTQEPGIDQDWLKFKLKSCADHMKKNGRPAHMTFDRMKEEGQAPRQLLAEYADMLYQAGEDGIVIVGHNVVQFDAPFFERAVLEWLDLDWPFPELVFDTAAVVKATLVGMPPFPEETLREYFFRVLERPAPGTCYNLDTYCVNKFKLPEKYPDLDMSGAHNAGFDSMLTHLLLEEFRRSPDWEE